MLNSKKHHNRDYDISKRDSSKSSKIPISSNLTRKSKINCTLSKNGRRSFVKSAPKSSWWCCLEDND